MNKLYGLTVPLPMFNDKGLTLFSILPVGFGTTFIRLHFLKPLHRKNRFLTLIICSHQSGKDDHTSVMHLYLAKQLHTFDHVCSIKVGQLNYEGSIWNPGYRLHIQFSINFFKQYLNTVYLKLPY